MGGSGGDYLCRRSFSVFRSTWDVMVVAYERPWSGVYATDLDVVLGGLIVTPSIRPLSRSFFGGTFPRPGTESPIPSDPRVAQAHGCVAITKRKKKGKIR